MTNIQILVDDDDKTKLKLKQKNKIIKTIKQKKNCSVCVVIDIKMNLIKMYI